MSIGFFSTLAGENADAARSWRNSARIHEENSNYWEERAIKLENELQDVHHSWKKHSDQLKNKIIEWQRASIESEAISRAKTAFIREENDGKGPKAVYGEDRYNEMVEAKKNEVIQEWGVNPWSDKL